MTTIALFGAGGKAGLRVARNLKDAPYRTLYVEISSTSIEALARLGLHTTPQGSAAAEADVVILSVPDVLIGRIAAQIAPSLRSGAMLICLDPAAPYGGALPKRDDLAYFVTHPCHPPIVNDETTPEARGDFFGGIAKQSIVCALMQGSEDAYALGEEVARTMFAPVLRTHRVTVEQMALLEPAMAETVVLTCMVVIKEAMDEAVRRGVPAEAARDFCFGHMNVNLGILFGLLDAQFSDGAKLMVERAKQQLLQPDWKKVFEQDNLSQQVQAILNPPKPGA
ncbi:MAG: phosphogluconate dehydrogenase C-terminal domain-containing protein [Anaerolineae bacterium]